MSHWKSRVLRLLPISVLQALKRIFYWGNRRFCPVCGRGSRVFCDFGVVTREDALCPFCGSLERHRLLWRFLEEKTYFFSQADVQMLHVAAEPCFEPLFRQRIGKGYLTADLMQPADVKMDVTDIQYPDASFDIVYCSHVLEHVPDDRRAMREFFRVLKPSGWAILLVPVTVERTFEDPSITDPQERVRLFGQDDHVRRYGHDYVDRLREAGFTVSVTSAGDFLSPEERTRISVDHPFAGDIFFCTKQAAAS